MVYHNLYHRIDGILLASSKYGKRQLGIKNHPSIGVNQKRRNILNDNDNYYYYCNDDDDIQSNLFNTDTNGTTNCPLYRGVRVIEVGNG